LDPATIGPASNGFCAASVTVQKLQPQETATTARLDGDKNSLYQEHFLRLRKSTEKLFRKTT
jgi:hypothetical protein